MTAVSLSEGLRKGCVSRSTHAPMIAMADAAAACDSNDTITKRVSTMAVGNACGDLNRAHLQVLSRDQNKDTGLHHPQDQKKRARAPKSGSKFLEFSNEVN